MYRLRISKGGNYFLVVIVHVMFLPRIFHAKDSLNWRYSFNPCASFKEGSPSEGDCQSDVAVSLLATIGI